MSPGPLPPKFGGANISSFLSPTIQYLKRDRIHGKFLNFISEAALKHFISIVMERLFRIDCLN
jgi:hypothetical protein